MRGLLGLLLAASLSAASHTAHAQYPARPITIVVPFAAGSGTDSIASIVGQQLSVALGQNVIVENKAGANGSIAATFVARAAPDGYTLLMATNSTHSANPSLLKSMSFPCLAQAFLDHLADGGIVGGRVRALRRNRTSCVSVR